MTTFLLGAKSLIDSAKSSRIEMTNQKIADIFEQVADLLEFKGANPFRIRAYRKGARVIRDLTEPVSEIINSDVGDLTAIDGVGKDLAAKCTELVQTGTLPMLEELLAEIPKSVMDLLRVPGLGPKKAKAVHDQLGITTLAELKTACEEGRVRTLKGFGEKTEQAILGGISIASAANQRILWAKADTIVQELRAHLEDCESVRKLEFAGSYRRGRDTVGDLDILAVADDGKPVMDRLAEYPDLSDVLVRGDTKMSIRLENGLQVDLRVVPAESFGAALQYFTGSKDHNVVVRGMAKKQGLRVNEYGVFRESDDGQVSIAGSTEEEVYQALGLPCFRPELREARDEFKWAENNDLPELVEISDIKGDLHMHTTATDGKNSIEEMVAAARERGLEYIAITDHSKRVSMANGLDGDRLLDQWKMIDEINQSIGSSFTVLKGIECDILESGGMDLDDTVLSQADWVLASVHYGQNQSRQQITDRILGALQNPYVTAIAHPTGRLINKRKPYEVDLDAVYQAAKENGKMLELNANPKRLDLNELNCAAAKRHGIPIVISTDAHSVGGLDVLRFGILQARRAGLTKHDVANTRSWPQLSDDLGKKNVAGSLANSTVNSQ